MAQGLGAAALVYFSYIQLLFVLLYFMCSTLVYMCLLSVMCFALSVSLDMNKIFLPFLESGLYRSYRVAIERLQAVQFSVRLLES